MTNDVKTINILVILTNANSDNKLCLRVTTVNLIDTHKHNN